MKEYRPYLHLQGITIPHWLLSLPKLSFMSKSVYMLLATYDGPNGCYPSHETLSKEMGIGPRQIARHIDNLRNRKLIKTKKRQSSSLYTFLEHPAMKNGSGLGVLRSDRTHLSGPLRSDRTQMSDEYKSINTNISTTISSTNITINTKSAKRFERWWKLYDRKERKNVAKAQWCRLPTKDQKKCLDIETRHTYQGYTRWWFTI